MLAPLVYCDGGVISAIDRFIVRFCECEYLMGPFRQIGVKPVIYPLAPFISGQQTRCAELG